MTTIHINIPLFRTIHSSCPLHHTPTEAPSCPKLVEKGLQPYFLTNTTGEFSGLLPTMKSQKAHPSPF